MVIPEEFIVLDTETTGLNHNQGDRLVEIGCVEFNGLYETGRRFHTFINPYPRQVDPEALAVHGLSNQFLMDKPKFRSVYREFLEYIGNKPLVIHNAPFDMGFINSELANQGQGPLQNEIINSLEVARAKHPGSKVSLDALCSRYGIDNSDRTLHGAIIDCVLLGQVFLKLIERDRLKLSVVEEEVDEIEIDIHGYNRVFRPSRGIIVPTEQELLHHKAFLQNEIKDALWFQQQN